MNNSDNKKIKLKVSLTGIEIEAFGYGSKEVSKITIRLILYTVLLMTIIICAAKFL